MASEGSSPKDVQEKEGEKGLPPITPAKRKRLQQAFEAANMQMRQGQHDYATELFTQCVLGDPANAAYAQSFLANLKQKYNNNKKGSNLAAFTGLGTRAMVKKASVQKDWMKVLKHGLDALKLNPWHVGTLRHLARASDQLGCLDCQLWFLRTALEYDPKDPDVNRDCAMALRSKKQFDQAIACWHRVEQARPGNEEAARAIASLSVEKTIVEGKYGDDSGASKTASRGASPRGGDTVELTPEQRLERDIRRNPKDLTKYIELSELYIREEIFSKAAEVLARAVEVSGGDLDMQERLEDAQMRHLRQQLAKMEKQHQQTGREEDKRRYEEAKRQVLGKDVEMCKKRVERYPNNLGYKFDLGQRYQFAGKYNEAIAEYQAARNDPRRKGLCVLALGECFQQIQQYRLAMSHFEEAVKEIPDRDPENQKKALYRAGKLAVKMRNIDVGEQYLTALAGLDFSYKDVPALLDKVAEIRKILGAQQADQTPPQQGAEEQGGRQAPGAEPA